MFNGTVLSILIGLALALGAVALALIYLADEGLRRRLSVAGGRRDATSNVNDGGLSWLARFGERLQSGNAQSSVKLGALKLKLVRAGVYANKSVEVFSAIRVLLALALSFLAGVALVSFGADNALIGALAVVVSAGFGLYLPMLVLNARVNERVQAVRLGLPDAVDLLVVCMEAGSSITQALQRVAQEMALAHPVVSEQLQITLLEMQAGASRAEALRNLSERVPDDRLRTLVTMVIQSDQLGSGLAATLRVFAEEMRRARFIEAEHKAAELPVKIAIPLVFFIFPCLMGIIFTPIIIRFIRILFQAGAQ
jgi:tight adherence protein C